MATPPSITQNITGNGNFVTATGNIIHQQLSPADTRTRQDLRRLLERVRDSWIQGYLKKSVHGAVLLNLRKQMDSDAVDHPGSIESEFPVLPQQALPQDVKIIDIFHQEGDALLILGEPGSGKTVTLLDLASGLIAEAENDPEFGKPIPVVFSLSNWSRQPLIDWMAKELSAHYRIPVRCGRTWLEEYRLLPLLDGLDEVKAENRAACVEAINEYGKAFGLAGLVVCSRLTEYRALPVRLNLNSAVCLEALNSAQVDDYLTATGSGLEALRALLREDESLSSLAQSPLMLSVMSMAYQDAPMESALVDNGGNSVEERRRNLFNMYIERMFVRRGQMLQPFDRAHTMKWLTWLAQRMIEYKQDIFLIEQIQPCWLPNRVSGWAYILLGQFLSSAMLGLIPGILLKLPLQLILESSLLFGIIVGFGLGFLRIRQFEGRGFKVSTKFQPANMLGFGALSGIIIALVNLQTIEEIPLGFLLGLLVSISWLRSRNRHGLNDIQPIETLTWSWDGARRGAVDSLLFGWRWLSTVLGAIGSATSFGYVWQAVGQVIGIILMPVGALFGGMRSKVIESKSVPNQGIRILLRNATIAAVVFGIGAGIALLPFRPVMLAGAVSMGLFAALWYGGFDVLQHYILLLFLWADGCISWNYFRFLDYSSERIFLHKVGGSYIFIHRLLMEHFASLGAASEEWLSVEQRSKAADLVHEGSRTHRSPVVANLCEKCRTSAPVKHVNFYQMVGKVITSQLQQIEGNFCKTCIDKYFWEYTSKTLLLGWWSTNSFLITPFLVLNNALVFVLTLGMRKDQTRTQQDLSSMLS